MTTTQEQFQHHHALAQQGDVEAQYWIADCYDFGHNGAQQNNVEAFAWFQKAANQGSGKAKFRLGHCYFNGKGVEPGDEGMGRMLWKESIPLMVAEAEEHGDAEAMDLLRLAYRNGKGVEKSDAQQALYWMRQAAEHEHADSQFSLGQAYEHGWFGLEQNMQLAFSWYNRAAQNDNQHGQCQLAQWYRDGEEGVKKDWIQAMHWYQIAAKANGSVRMQSDLEELQQEIAAVQKRLEEGVKNSLKKCPPLSLWSLLFASLLVPHHQPAGFTPTMLAMKALVPLVFKDKAEGLHRGK